MFTDTYSVLRFDICIGLLTGSVNSVQHLSYCRAADRQCLQLLTVFVIFHVFRDVDRQCILLLTVFVICHVCRAVDRKCILLLTVFVICHICRSVDRQCLQ